MANCLLNPGVKNMTKTNLRLVSRQMTLGDLQDTVIPLRQKIRSDAEKRILADRIHSCNEEMYDAIKRLFAHKKTEGICRGSVGCMRPVAKEGERLCIKHQRLFHVYAQNAKDPRRKVRAPSDYQMIRRAMLSEDRKERERRG